MARRRRSVNDAAAGGSSGWLCEETTTRQQLNYANERTRNRCVEVEVDVPVLDLEPGPLLAQPLLGAQSWFRLAAGRVSFRECLREPSEGCALI